MKSCYVHPFKVKEIRRFSMSDKYVGLLLITFNDADNLEKMLPSLEATVDYPMCLTICDIGSTDETISIISNWKNKNNNIYDINVFLRERLESLTKTMNHGFKHLMSRQECDYIGWIHPDASYEEGWLSQLVSTLQEHPEIAKICSHNSRDGYSSLEAPYPGHEQVYIIRRGILFKVGLFDEAFVGIGGFEDLDLNRRIIQEGWKVAIDPKSNVNHTGMGTRSKRDTSQEQMHNRGVYFNKWGDVKDGEMFT